MQVVILAVLLINNKYCSLHLNLQNPSSVKSQAVLLAKSQIGTVLVRRSSEDSYVTISHRTPERQACWLSAARAWPGCRSSW